jgi:hypothetical protein
MTTINDINRRCSERIQVNRTVAIQNPLKPIEISSFAKILDLSNCGLAFVGTDLYPQDLELTLVFTLPDYETNNTLSILSKVERSQAVQHRYLTGLTFPNLTPHESLIIRAYISFHRRFQA